jgi:hypothetical protein
LSIIGNVANPNIKKTKYQVSIEGNSFNSSPNIIYHFNKLYISLAWPIA